MEAQKTVKNPIFYIRFTIRVMKFKLGRIPSLCFSFIFSTAIRKII